ncbi:hypothetical protein E2C01_065059 [Portunus trituberculatus]|uniref:Uncharacterized protein n=1 Tax=Portunus trituberculatus TaxID=210409 RepID=A0A5B7HEN5_PORTR|nr:hypothetical protein [Portunus trituberculatus]
MVMVVVVVVVLVVVVVVSMTSGHIGQQCTRDSRRSSDTCASRCCSVLSSHEAYYCSTIKNHDPYDRRRCVISLTHSLTHARTHALTHALVTYYILHSLTRSLTHSLTHSFIHSFNSFCSERTCFHIHSGDYLGILYSLRNFCKRLK